jgi:hypothetical protein
MPNTPSHSPRQPPRGRVFKRGRKFDALALQEVD